mgnify:CR=1
MMHSYSFVDKIWIALNKLSSSYFNRDNSLIS